jgi:hypothetical protein
MAYTQTGEASAANSNTEDLRETLTRLEREVRQLRDRQAIGDCLNRYSRGLDRHDDELLSSVYHGDAIDHHGPPFLGPPRDFVPWAHKLHTDDYFSHQHYVTNNTVDIDGDVAHSEIYFQAVLRRKDGLLDLRGGRYIDRLERRDGVWRVAGREVLVDWASTTGGAVLEMPTGTWDRTDVSYQRPLAVPALDPPFLDAVGESLGTSG